MGKWIKIKDIWGKITFLTVLNNIATVINAAFKTIKEVQAYVCRHPLIKVTFPAGFFYPNNLWFTEHLIKCYILAKT